MSDRATTAPHRLRVRRVLCVGGFLLTSAGGLEELLGGILQIVQGGEVTAEDQLVGPSADDSNLALQAGDRIAVVSAVGGPGADTGELHAHRVAHASEWSQSCDRTHRLVLVVGDLTAAEAH